jgi:hypothetical protein
VDRSLHYAMDSYEFLAITVSLTTGKWLIQFLEDNLCDRQEQMDTAHVYLKRQFSVCLHILHCLLVLMTISQM